MNELELRNAREFNRDKNLREEAMTCRYMFNGMRPNWVAERENLLGQLFGSKNVRI